MDAARHDHICGIFEQAIALPQEQRAALLERSCAGDASLRAEVDSLIAANQRANPMLDAGALALLTQPEDDENPDLTGQRIGRYELRRVIACGGMGIVYEAMQEQPRRTVAVKVLRRLGSPSAVRRFHEEAQILARLSHPHIAHVYEAGTHIDGSSRGDNEHLPFFAMEYISGARPLTEYAVERRLPIRERLLLFIRVCEAVQHGHQKGIIHRDLKPANILVDADGVPKVIDFGVARVLDLDGESRMRHTLAGRVVGTLPYCSPEQIDENAGDVDSRSDVYALGTMLYELLAGVPAFKTDGRSTWQTMTMIRESSPQPLRTLNREFRGDLDAIVSKAMEKNPDRRYQSVESLKREIERRLSGEPIEARRRSAWISVTSWMGRHPVATTATTAVSVAVVVLFATFVTIWYGNHQPFDITTTSDGRAAHMITRFGRVLATFGGDAAPPASVFARFARSPLEGQVAVFSVLKGENSTNQQLRVARPGSLDRPIWETTPHEPREYPPLPAAWNLPIEGTGYAVDRFLFADVFAETAGNEIVVLHSALKSSQYAIRVYDFAGNVLFEAWHLGRIAQIYWWDEQGLLICAGDRHGRPDVNRFGYLGLPWPRIVFAIRPQFGQQTGWLNEAGWPPEWRTDASHDTVLAWYRVLAPQEYANIFAATKIFADFSREGDPPCVSIAYESSEYGKFDIRVNPRGEFVGVDPSDEYYLAHDRLPPGIVRLVDWPPGPTDQ